MSTPSPKETPIPGTTPTRKLASGGWLNTRGSSFIFSSTTLRPCNITICFAQEPSKKTGAEIAAFKPFEKAIQNIISACLSLVDSRSVSFTYVNNRDKSEEEEWSEQEAHQAIQQLQVVHQMFPRVALHSASDIRYSQPRLMQQSTASSVFAHLIKHLPSAFLPAASQLDVARVGLLERYRIAEAGPVKHSSVSIIASLGHSLVIFSLFDIVKMLKRNQGVM
ncbi:hypothetical protein PILCRDRAFT_814538 [Piloderma croceum F 1598]|uniref:Uncharacterized protein n=1 Tax=Piloderma croceum (strain F 1598) TaxID=765440 RepID=A0A0C3G7S5_PILCF|nr:hypothetical protein PILCRDRAFT_814538 [Piloderma croceum F 1598]